eukprot:scaffold106273_cov47-Attheya_sp.AAC.2
MDYGYGAQLADVFQLGRPKGRRGGLGNGGGAFSGPGAVGGAGAMAGFVVLGRWLHRRKVGRN